MFLPAFEDAQSSASDTPSTAPAALEPISFEQVAAAARQLAAANQPVTVATVRDALGDVSLAAIHPHLAAWRASQALPESPLLALPDAVSSALLGWAQQLADEAGSGLRDQLAQTDGDLAALLQSQQQLEADHAALQAQLAKVTADRDQAMVTLAECDAQIERLTVELQHARDIASDALVGKAKDQLAIEGKDAQLADLRQQLERNVAATSAESDARLATAMELVGAVTARDNLAAEVKELRAQLEACRAERRAS
ncbi:DNA-binding protein [Vogesella sp. LIG4]|uniref:DNA-binding protein n=1 Tax=Vogesella sp. LIG4 TaxID=1192162 RepID=UPI00081FE5DC|nr:DNA-binding protein [Vogesella sp. LIG4]SCK25710.1 replication region DNA-binding N-term [Vogesella sp. LIG4]